MSDDLSNRFSMIGLIHFPIDIIKEVKSFHAQFSDRVRQLFRAELAESLRAWILLLGAKPASLPA